MRADPKHLQELLDGFRVDEVLSLVTLEEIADAWCRYQERHGVDGVDDEDPDWWAVELLMDSGFGSDELRVRAILDLLIDRAGDHDVLEVVAAGPLEDFVKAADKERLRWIVQRGEESPRFRQALQGIYVSGLPPDEVVPGDLPGTRQIKRNAAAVAELETEPGRVEDMVDLLRRYL